MEKVEHGESCFLLDSPAFPLEKMIHGTLAFPHVPFAFAAQDECPPFQPPPPIPDHPPPFSHPFPPLIWVCLKLAAFLLVVPSHIWRFQHQYYPTNPQTKTHSSTHPPSFLALPPPTHLISSPSFPEKAKKRRSLSFPSFPKSPTKNSRSPPLSFPSFPQKRSLPANPQKGQNKSRSLSTNPPRPKNTVPFQPTQLSPLLLLANPSQGEGWAAGGLQPRDPGAGPQQLAAVALVEPLAGLLAALPGRASSTDPCGGSRRGESALRRPAWGLLHFVWVCVFLFLRLPPESWAFKFWVWAILAANKQMVNFFWPAHSGNGLKVGLKKSRKQNNSPSFWAPTILTYIYMELWLLDGVGLGGSQLLSSP